MNLKEKLETILEYKNDIKNSLINKGSDIDDSTPLSGYAEKIDNLSSSEEEEVPVLIKVCGYIDISTTISDLTIDNEQALTKLNNTLGNYRFIYSESNWNLRGNVVTDISQYGISYTGTPAEGDTIILFIYDKNGGWIPDPNWWDIEEIIQNDSNPDILDDEILDRCKKVILLEEDNTDTSSWRISWAWSNGNPYAIKTSDGSFYRDVNHNNPSITHTWDKSQGKLWKGGKKTRYIILYYDVEYQYNVLKAISQNYITKFLSKNSLYLIIGGDFEITGSSNQHFGYFTQTLQAVEMLDGCKIVTSTEYSMCNTFQNCWGLKHVPSNPLAYVLTEGFKNTGWNIIAYTPNLLNHPMWYRTSYNTMTFSTAGYQTPTVQDVSMVDFSRITDNNIITQASGQQIEKVKGVIDLSYWSCTNSTLILFSNIYRYIKDFKVIFPSNVTTIQIMGGCENQPSNLGFWQKVSEETVLFMAENAPVTTNCTIQAHPSILQAMKDCSTTINYNGEEMFPHEVLIAKGYTIQDNMNILT